MAISIAEIEALPDYTDAHQLKLAKYTLAVIKGGGQARGIDGRMKTEADIAKIEKHIEWLESRINAETAEATSGIALVRYGERV